MYMMMYIGSMSHRYSIADARTSLSNIVDQAEAGQRVELTRRGRPVAVIVSVREFERLRVGRPKFNETYQDFLAKYSPEAIGLDDDFAASVRDKSPGRKVSL